MPDVRIASTSYRLAILLGGGAFVVATAVIMVYGHVAGCAPGTDTRLAPAPVLERQPPDSRVTTAAGESANATPRVNVAMQKPGLPDPASERAAADSAARAADAAAALASATPSMTN